ncbi:MULTISPECIES: hypothetical protein [Pirellulaceae]|nr:MULTISPECIES: hypothetical protein [Pirellulaceae]
MHSIILLGIIFACGFVSGCEMSYHNDRSQYSPHTKDEARSDTVYTVDEFPRMKKDPRFASYERIHWDGSKKIPWAVEMEKQYPDIDHFITHFGIDNNLPTIWNSEVHFGDRYVITLQVPVVIDYKLETLQVTGEPKFFLSEITSVEVDGSGLYGESFHFGEAEFDELIESNWNYAAINIVINSNPTPRFQLAKAMAQSPRYPIQLMRKE